MKPRITLVEGKGFKAYTRDGTSDKFIFREIILGNEYRHLNIEKGTVLLDVGMNIGLFTMKAARLGAKVYGFEPDPENFQLAKANLRLNGCLSMEGYPEDGNLALYEKAVTGTDEPVRSFSINLKKNKAAHSLVAKRGRDSINVQCESFTSVLARVQPDIIKMDIEGGEYECIKSVTDYGNVQEFVLEFHHAHLNDIKTHEKYHEIVGILEQHFGVVKYRPETKGAWVTLIYCSKPRRKAT